MNVARDLVRAFENIATAPDRTFKAPRRLPAPWTVTLPAVGFIIGCVVGLALRVWP
jgi:hypothetical protein